MSTVLKKQLDYKTFTLLHCLLYLGLHKLVTQHQTFNWYSNYRQQNMVV